jgi:hypothetical protein
MLCQSWILCLLREDINNLHHKVICSGFSTYREGGGGKRTEGTTRRTNSHLLMNLEDDKEKRVIKKVDKTPTTAPNSKTK